MFILVAVTKVCLRKQVAASISLQVARRLHVEVTESSFFFLFGEFRVKSFWSQDCKQDGVVGSMLRCSRQERIMTRVHEIIFRA